MKALVVQTNQLRLQELPVIEPPVRSARVRVRAAGICATDLHILSGKIKFARAARVLGHEIAGTVESVGKEVTTDWIGKSVIVDPVVGCGECPWCHSGRKLLCQTGGELGSAGGDGGYAEYVTVPSANLYALPKQLSFEEGALIEPLNCVYGAFTKSLPRPGESVLVFGSGPAGLLFVQLARAYGCGPILVADGSPLRLKLGRKLGATEAWNYRDPQFADFVLKETDGEGPDIVVEASGSDAAVQQAFSLVRRGGRVVLYGTTGAHNPNIASDLIVAKDLVIVTGIGSPLLWNEVIRLVASGKIDLKTMVTHQFTLEEFERALAVARDTSVSGKVIFCP